MAGENGRTSHTVTQSLTSRPSIEEANKTSLWSSTIEIDIFHASLSFADHCISWRQFFRNALKAASVMVNGTFFFTGYPIVVPLVRWTSFVLASQTGIAYLFEMVII